MKSNVDKVLEREGKLSQLEERADRLQEGTEQFHRSATRIKKKTFLGKHEDENYNWGCDCRHHTYNHHRCSIISEITKQAYRLFIANNFIKFKKCYLPKGCIYLIGEFF